ncbi:MAG TPA: hypothetical protein VGM82_18265 [Gemmatimonadaceae bacterium]|jgi:hypothetical protein
MQTTPVAPESGDLRELWSSTARRATDAQLVACVAIALAAASGFGIGALIDFRSASRWWPIVVPALMLGTFGAWGIADRELNERSTSSASTGALAAVKWCSAIAAGMLGAIAAIGVLRITIGTWIS